MFFYVSFRSEKPKIQSLGETASASHLELNSNAEEVQPEGKAWEINAHV